MSNSIKLCSKKNKSATPVSNNFIDHYMLEANGEFVKIYLYLLRCINSDKELLSLSKIADKFNNTEKDIKRALKYWEKMDLLKLDYSDDEEISGIDLLDIPCPVEATKKVSATPVEDKPVLTPVAKKPSDSKSQADSKKFKQLLFIAEQYIGKTLTPTEIDKILYFHDELGFSVDLIEYLIEYCVHKNHKNMRYIEATALEWHKSNIKDVRTAKKLNDSFSTIYSIVMKSYGISGRDLIDAEKEYIKRWSTSYGFSKDLISLACNRTILAIHNPNFDYTEQILKNWKSAGVTSVADVDAADMEHKKKNISKDKVSAVKIAKPNRFNNYKQRSYDFNDLEYQLISSSNK